MTHPHLNRRFVPQAVLTRSVKINIAGTSVNTVGGIFTSHKAIEKYSEYKNSISIKGIMFYFTDTNTECLVLSSDFKLLDESQVLLRVPRKDNIYSVDLKSVVPTKGLTCLFAKATIDESNLWHRRLGHINFKNMNKLVRGNLVRGLPSKIFENDHSCVACQKGKQHKASCKAKLVNSISKPLHMLHMDLFGPTNVKSLMKKSYCLVVTDDFSRFSWVFFLATKDETSGILKTFITEIENQLDHKVKVIRCDNGTEFKNSVMNQFCEMKGIKREFSVARTPQQNGVAERRNRTLIEAARTIQENAEFQQNSGLPLYMFDQLCSHSPEGKGSTIPPEPQPTPSTSQPNWFTRTSTESLQTEKHLQQFSHELQTEAHTEQILLSPSTNQRKQRKTQKHKRAKQVTELPQTSVLLDHGAEMWQSQAPRNHGGALAQTSLIESLEKSPMNHLSQKCTKLSKQVLDLDKEKDAQVVWKSLKLKQISKKLEEKEEDQAYPPKKEEIQQVESSDDDWMRGCIRIGRNSDRGKVNFLNSDFDVP
ncbi:putative ribonuclease H-like domain-containing protein [Tanacetum coccineum]|uniref:Ribonuclease H-like domain-containing protein n=1 Tax=Tanacetum coccineum TaxID=301880 RepID=A0ABQ5AUB3_9ASTR